MRLEARGMAVAAIASLAGSAALLPAVAMASDKPALSFIVDRSDGDMAYYMSMSAEHIVPLLDADPALVFSNSGAVPIETFRREGSFDLADEVFRHVRSDRPAGANAFYSMSLMLHPTDFPLPFETPFDGLTAVSVCTVDYDFSTFAPGDLNLFYGAYAYEVAPTEAVSLTFPATGRETLDVVIRHYTDGRFVGEERASLADGGTLTFAPQDDPMLPVPPAALAFAGFAVLLLGAWRFAIPTLRS